MPSEHTRAEFPTKVRLSCATDAPPTSLFIFQPLLANRLSTSNLPFILPTEELLEGPVEPFMKTKYLFGLVATVAVTGFAASAQAGWSLNFSFAAPVVYAPPVVVAAPIGLPPVTICPPVVAYRPTPCRPVVYIAPSYVRCYDYRGPAHGQRGRGPEGRGHDRGGRR